ELDSITAKSIAISADAGDPTAIEVYAISARHLGAGISIMIDILNPEKIVIGSIFARSENLLRPEMQKVIDREALANASRVCQVVPALLGESIGDIAAVSVASNGLLQRGK
ncbi:MAG: ROK family protein, partial [Opitutales bacterium]|nr:ROK family protein [Opitutales bacterium]